LTINETAPRLVSFGGTYHGPVIIDDKVYVLWVQGKSFSKLIYNDVDNSENLQNLMPNTHPITSVWLLEIGNADDNRGTLLNYYRVGNSSMNITPASSQIDGFFHRKGFTLLDNGYFTFEVRENPPPGTPGELQRYTYVIDPNNPETPVHVFTDVPGGAEDIIVCDNKYYLSSRDDKRIFVYDDAFNLIDENYLLDFAAGKPGELSCLSNNDGSHKKYGEKS